MNAKPVLTRVSFRLFLFSRKCREAERDCHLPHSVPQREFEQNHSGDAINSSWKCKKYVIYFWRRIKADCEYWLTWQKWFNTTGKKLKLTQSKTLSLQILMSKLFWLNSLQLMLDGRWCMLCIVNVPLLLTTYSHHRSAMKLVLELKYTRRLFIHVGLKVDRRKQLKQCIGSTALRAR